MFSELTTQSFLILGKIIDYLQREWVREWNRRLEEEMEEWRKQNEDRIRH